MITDSNVSIQLNAGDTRQPSHALWPSMLFGPTRARCSDAPYAKSRMALDVLVGTRSAVPTMPIHTCTWRKRYLYATGLQCHLDPCDKGLSSVRPEDLPPVVCTSTFPARLTDRVPGGERTGTGVRSASIVTGTTAARVCRQPPLHRTPACATTPASWLDVASDELFQQ